MQKTATVPDFGKYPIPQWLNIALLIAVFPISWIMLMTASYGSWPWIVFAAIGFAWINNTLFALLHEAVHGVLVNDRRWNDRLGRMCSVCIPTSFSLQRAAHLGHHRRNRTDDDIYDYYLPHQSRFLRSWYLITGNLLGFYWFTVVLSNLILVFIPWIYHAQWFKSGPARWFGFKSYLNDIQKHSTFSLWLECMASMVYHLMLIFLFGVTWQGWLICYASFAVLWSTLQYVHHAWSPRDIIHGAWNLRVSTPIQWLLLNYNYHLAHHRHPQLPWIYLDRFVDEKETRPGFFSIYFRMWKGAQPAPPMTGPCAK